MTDAIVIGAGPNGLVAANILADAGWSVVVVEAQDAPGGAVRTAELTLPGFQHDVFSAFYPFAPLSPAMRCLALERYGLVWRHAPIVLANPTPDGRCAVISTDIDVTAASLDEYHQGDGDAWRHLYGVWERIGMTLVDALFSPLPPIVSGARLVTRVGASELGRLARMALLTTRRLAEEEFSGEGAGLLLAGLTAHTDLSPESAGGALFALLLAAAGQSGGFPVPQGGAGELTGALVRRLEARGGQVICGAPVTDVVVRQGRAVAVRMAGGQEIGAVRAVVADVGAPALYLKLVGERHLPPGVALDARRFEYDHATFKMDWALDAPVPWSAEAARQAGTVHVADGIDDLSRTSYELTTGAIPSRPFILFGQQCLADPARAPIGAATGWAYTHVPQRVLRDAGGSLTGSWDRGECEAFADRMELRIEELAPGFRSLIRARHIQSPPELEARDANLVGGAVNGGTAQLHQQLALRPTPGLGRATTPIDGLFLASASAHPGGGVHGACGANAARAALAADRPLNRLLSRVLPGTH
ncbi:MAG: NAD(P)/FAD-dependent oxidoreductase [Actinomycetota bacterium]|nr:NAD(P)/FAD-dependent oxidoreductase [Actinomycetota bacterium]